LTGVINTGVKLQTFAWSYKYWSEVADVGLKLQMLDLEVKVTES
jgi:hypothetical protein